jgi:selenocysteine-specific elongation factor
MPHIIGTAGHIDHGKTALVRALTGQDTDRLKEEKERGISIDLGFAYLELASGERAGIVDVPGHERFIRNMLAGAHGIDLVLLVVAADDGVMPQTEEHLDIVHLLGVRRAIVVITKIDLVPAERLGVVREEIEILLAGTGLEASPVVPVSATRGDGIDRLRESIEESLAAIEPRVPAPRFRMPIDRAFVLHGHGTVVTGTALAGSVRPGDVLRVLPGEFDMRVRHVQVHDREVEEAACGQRVALNLASAERSQVGRGQVLCTPGFGCVSDRFDAFIEIRPGAAKGVKSHAGVRLHAGTAEALGKVVWLDGRAEVKPRERALGQIVLREPMCLLRGDRFILRDETAQRTLGGGTIVHPLAQRHRWGSGEVSPLLASLQDAATPAAVVRALLDLQTAPASEIEWLARAGGLTEAEVVAAVATDESLRALPAPDAATACTTVEKWRQLQDAVVAELRSFHSARPLDAGMEMEALRAAAARDWSPKIFRTLVDALAGDGVVAREQSLLRLPSHRVALRRDEADAAARAEAMIAAAGVTPPSLKDVEKSVGVARTKLQTILKQLEREGRLVQVDGDLWFARAPLEHVRTVVREHAAAHGQIDAATLRDLLGASRKFSIALLDYFDRTGFTMRVGDVRKLRSR